MIIVAPEAAGERRDRGYVYQRLECWRPALQDLTEYLEREPDAADVHEVRASVMELSRRCARASTEALGGRALADAGGSAHFQRALLHCRV